MAKLPFSWVVDEELRRPRLQPFLLFALALSLLAFCSTLLARM